MTTETDPFESDELVTETYRELGVDKAPEHLNQSILRMASGGAKQSGARNPLFAAWMKPVAWAATIGLSLAIVLELTQVPTPAVRSDGAPAAGSIREEAALQDADKSEKAENQARMQSGPNRQAISEDELGRDANSSDSARKSTAPGAAAVFTDAIVKEISSTDTVTDDVEVFSRETKGKLDAVAAQSPSPSPVSAAELPASPQTSARKRAADLPADSEPMASFSVLAEQNESDIDESCDAAVRLAREDWLECIDNLRQSGADEAADLEYEAFVLEYPIETRNLELNK
jgi:hypothetical protein